MGNPTGFLEIARAQETIESPTTRRAHWREFTLALDPAQAAAQGARCMDCGVPFCQSGCPVDNIIPDWNDLVYRGEWRQAIDSLHATNNFPEFTGRVCPAPCEAACTLNFNDDAVTIKALERAIIDRAFAEGWVAPRPPAAQSGKKIAVVGSGPAGLACAQQLARAGHAVCVFEKNENPGGLLRYGIPDFKMEKNLIDRRLSQMRAEGVEFRAGVHVGVNFPAAQLLAEFDAVALCGGCETPRDLPAPGRELDGIHFAMDFLPQQNRRVAGAPVGAADILATGKNVVVIGGGDTGSDCIGTSNRQGARQITQLELLPRPPTAEDKMTSWPDWPLKLRTSSSHQEGCERDWSVITKRFEGDNGRVKKIVAARLEWARDENGQTRPREIPESEFDIPADLVLLAMGYLRPAQAGLLEDLGLDLDARGNVKTREYESSRARVFAGGDMRRGQSLVVWAIREGRECAAAIDRRLRA